MPSPPVVRWDTTTRPWASPRAVPGSAVKRHFLEMGVDTQSEDFTVVGIGDMSGDVFGNGMLLSEHIGLVAAFDHRDIFLDPTPDPAVGFQEAQAPLRVVAFELAELQRRVDQCRGRGLLGR
ncbi:MAG: NAD-glutamate dehydrogenase [Candidatus Nanopelagicales bacterium]